MAKGRKRVKKNWVGKKTAYRGDLLQRAKRDWSKKSASSGLEVIRHEVTAGDIPAAQRSALGVLLDVLLFGREYVWLLPGVFPQG